MPQLLSPRVIVASIVIAALWMLGVCFSALSFFRVMEPAHRRHLLNLFSVDRYMPAFAASIRQMAAFPRSTSAASSISVGTGSSNKRGVQKILDGSLFPPGLPLTWDLVGASFIVCAVIAFFVTIYVRKSLEREAALLPLEKRRRVDRYHQTEPQFIDPPSPAPSVIKKNSKYDGEK